MAILLPIDTKPTKFYFSKYQQQILMCPMHAVIRTEQKLNTGSETGSPRLTEQQSHQTLHCPFCPSFQKQTWVNTDEVSFYLCKKEKNKSTAPQVCPRRTKHSGSGHGYIRPTEWINNLTGTTAY